MKAMENKEYLEAERERLQKKLESTKNEGVVLELLREIDSNNRKRLAALRDGNEK